MSGYYSFEYNLIHVFYNNINIVTESEEDNHHLSKHESSSRHKREFREQDSKDQREHEP